MTSLKDISGSDKAQELLFDMAPYGASKFNSVAEVYRSLPVDGYCPYCRNTSTFSGNSMVSGEGKITVVCARNKLHLVVYYFRHHHADGGLMKIGQYPSYVDLKKDDTDSYAKSFKEDDTKEFRKATLLAAYGMSIGSYVYLRRIFERLIRTTFDEVKDQRGWTDDDFPFHMSQRIDLLKKDLPEILVKNAAIYGILSEGIHQLDEDKCNSYLPILQKAIIFIARDNLQRKQEAREREDLDKALKNAFSEVFKPRNNGDLV